VSILTDFEFGESEAELVTQIIIPTLGFCQSNFSFGEFILEGLEGFFVVGGRDGRE
jgi:hypothetical protein